MIFPGPAVLGRGVVVGPDDPIPDPARDWPRLRIDESTLAAPTVALEQLQTWWRDRIPATVILAADFAALKAPESDSTDPYLLTPAFEFAREGLHFLTWVNRYDGRDGVLRWHHGERALALGADATSEADVLVGGEETWIDGGPPWPRKLIG